MLVATYTVTFHPNYYGIAATVLAVIALLAALSYLVRRYRAEPT